MPRCLLTVFRRLAPCQQRRCLLTRAYYCESAWESRLRSNGLKNVNPYELVNSLVIRAQTGQLISAIDLDIAANVIIAQDQLLELEDLVFRFRHSKNAVTTLHSTHYAICRAYVKFGQEDKLMKLLADRVNYGVFPDSYASNLLMDSFLKAGQTTNAAKVASLLMQQEEFSVESSRWLMIYSCLKWMSNPNPAEWIEVKREEDQREDDGDELIFRLPFLKNRYDDRHFDLVKGDDLVGKTLLRSSNATLKKLNADDGDYNLFLNCKVLGATLLMETNVSQAVLNSAASFRPYKLVVDKLSQLNDDLINQMISRFEVVDEDLLLLFEQRLKARLPDLEEKDTKAQEQLFVHWNEARERKIEITIERYLKAEKLKMLDQQIGQLKTKQQHVFFFENKEELEKKLPPKVESEQVEPPKKCEILSRSAKRRAARAQAAAGLSVPSDEQYVVPELTANRPVLANSDQSKY